jgi:hypothetical protein
MPRNQMSVVGTFETIQDVSSLVATGGKADNICSMRGLLSLTQSGHGAITPQTLKWSPLSFICLAL